MAGLRWKALAMVGALIAVAALPATAQDKEPEAARKVKTNKYLITAEEIVDRPEMSTAYDVVKQLRPNFLKQTSLKGRISSGYSMGASRGPDLGTCRRDCPADAGTGSGSSGGTGSGTGSSGAGTQGTVGSTPRGGPDLGGLDDNARGMVSAVLYIDDMRQPTLEALKTVRATEVVEVRYLNGTEALGKYGSGHEGGAVLLKTKRMPVK